MPQSLWSTDVARTPEPKRPTEGRYEFLDRHAGPAITAVRVLLDEWFANYPVEYQPEFCARFRAEVEPAYHELLLHQLFLQNGYQPEVAPRVPWSSTRPDFLVTRGNLSFYVEAAVVTDKAPEERARDRIQDSIAEAINKLDSPNFFIRDRKSVV